MERGALVQACGTLCNRDALQRCDWAFCEFCRQSYAPLRIRSWRDPDPNGRGQTAVCPACGVTAVTGYQREAASERIDRS